MDSTKRISRPVSIKRVPPLPRRPTKGPLDDPLLDDRVHTPVKDEPHIPRALTSPVGSREHAASLDQPLRDFNYLLHSQNYHALEPLDPPVAFRKSTHKPPSNTPLAELLSKGHFRLAAIAAARQLTTPPSPTSHTEIFSLFFTRLSCLVLINATEIAAQESKLLGDLDSTLYLHSVTNHHLLPWELRVLAVRLQGIGFGDLRKGVVGYYDMAREARIEAARAQSAAEIRVWKARLLDLGPRVASLLVEMDDLGAAVRHLETLRVDNGAEAEDDMLCGRLALLHLRIGNVESARRYISPSGDTKPSAYAASLQPLLEVAQSSYGAAISQLSTAREGSTASGSLAKQNLAVCLLYSGNLNEARKLLEEMVDKGEDFNTLLFNLSTVFELATDRSRALKMQLAEDLASKEPSVLGWEKTGAVLKL